MDVFSSETWAEYDPEGLITLRLEQIRRIIPADVNSILDAGCGNGMITNTLYPDFKVTGLDISPAALKHVNAPKVHGSVTSIPFPKRFFDLVMCNEVLEHLNHADLIKAVSELQRCAAKYLLISVPNREQLDAELVRCASCRHVFHAYGHLQSFSLARLDFLTGWQRIWDTVVGPANRTFSPTLLKFRQQHLHQWFKPDVPLGCPNCNGRDFWIRKNLLTKAVNLLGRLGRNARPYWLMAMYKSPSKPEIETERI